MIAFRIDEKLVNQLRQTVKTNHRITSMTEIVEQGIRLACTNLQADNRVEKLENEIEYLKAMNASLKEAIKHG